MEVTDEFAMERARYFAGWLQYGIRNVIQDMRSVTYWSRRIKTRRAYETNFEDQIDQTEKALSDALEGIRAIRARYKALPPQKSAEQDRLGPLVSHRTDDGS